MNYNHPLGEQSAKKINIITKNGFPIRYVKLKENQCSNGLFKPKLKVNIYIYIYKYIYIYI